MKTVAVNRKAKHDYEILEKFDAGIVLSGDEVKSIRSGNVNLKDSFAVVKSGEIFLINLYISKYSHSFSKKPTDESRSRKLLLTKKEIKRLIGSVALKGLTLVPLELYFSKKGLLKVKIALAKHKKSFNRKQELKERDLQRDARRDLKDKF